MIYSISYLCYHEFLSWYGKTLWTYDIDIDIVYDLPLIKISEGQVIFVSQNGQLISIIDLYTGNIEASLNTNTLNEISRIRTFELKDNSLIMGGKNKQNHGVLVGYDLTTYQRQWIQYHGSRREPSDIINCQGIPSNSENNVCIMFNSSVEVYAYNSEEIQFITQLQRQILPLSVYKKR